jgi:hypothetical protein
VRDPEGEEVADGDVRPVRQRQERVLVGEFGDR